MKNANLPAAPIGQQLNMRMVDPACNGLTKREHFASMAMQGLLSSPAMIDGADDPQLAWLTSHSVKIADALLAELEK